MKTIRQEQQAARARKVAKPTPRLRVTSRLTAATRSLGTSKEENEKA